MWYLFLFPLASSASNAVLESHFLIALARLAGEMLYDVVLLVTLSIAVFAVYRIGIYCAYSIRVNLALRKVPLPPKTLWLPFIGHAISLNRAEPWDLMMRWAQATGNTVRFNVLGQEVIYFNDPKMLKRILQSKQRIYRKDIASSYKQFLCLLGSGLVTSEDEKWRQGRLFLSHALRVDLVEVVTGTAYPNAQRLIQNVLKSDVIDMNEAFRHLTLQVIGELVLSLNHEESDAIFPKLYLPVVTECNRRVWSPWRAFMPWLKGSRDRNRCIAELNGVLVSMIRQRWSLRHLESKDGKEVKRRQDMLDHYLGQVKELSLETIEAVRDEIKTMLLAGHETSAATLTWSLFEVLSNPQYATKLRQEHKAVFGKFAAEGVPPTLDAVRSLRWSPAVIREVMRKYSVVPLVMRYASEDDFVPKADSGLDYDLTIPRGVSVMVGIAGVHHREDIWPEPSKFNPERFLGYSPETQVAASKNDSGDVIDQWSYIPFIAGPRNCLGQHVAFTEMQMVLSYLVMALTHEEKDGTVVVDYEIADRNAKAGLRHDYEIPVCPKFGLPIRRKR